MSDVPAEASPATTRPWLWRVLGASALILIPSVLALVLLATKFQGLRLSSTLEQAQIARHVAAGDGLTTDSIRPLSLAFRPELRHHPDLYHAPAHPLVLGFAYSVFRPSDRLTAAVGLCFWIASVLLTFILARRWFDPLVASVASILYCCNVAMLRAALLGMPYPLVALFLLMAAGLAVPKLREEDAPAAETESSGLRLAGVGFFCGLAAMSHYLFFFIAPAVGVPLALSRRRKGRAFLFFALGLLAVAVPWIIRNLRWGRGPFFSLYWYEALAGTDAFPGDTVWRSMTAAATDPVEFMIFHPIQTARKAMSGLVRFWQESLPVVDPIVAFLFVTALIGRASARWRVVLWSVAASVILAVGASVVLRAEPEILLAWTPLLAIVGAAQLVSLLQDWVDGISMRPHWEKQWIRSVFKSPSRARRAVQGVATALILAAVGFPLFHFIWVYRADPYAISPDAAALKQLVPEQSTVLTDQPAFVAWYAQRRSVWLFMDEKAWDRIESKGGTIDAAYITP